MTTEPQKEHQWLQKLVGEWTYETETTIEPFSPPQKFRGIESVRSIEGLWVIAEGQGEMGGGHATTMMTLGYDPQKQRYVGSWLGSMMTHFWVYEGAVDATGKILTLEAEGPSMSGDGKMAKYQDVIEFRSDDHRTLTGRVLGDDGKWSDIMTAHYRRKVV
jgi:hypothetical protein